MKHTLTLTGDLEVAIEAVKAAGEQLLRYFREGKYDTRFKEDTSLQTTADLAAEEAILRILRKAFHNHHIRSEERGVLPSNGSSPYHWNIDPLDGTENFALGIPYFSSSLTLSYEYSPILAVVYNPLTEDLFTAIKDQGAWHNDRPLAVSQHEDLRSSRAFFIPDFVTKRQPMTVRLRNLLYGHCRRVLDTWAPALDWCLVASGKVDLVVTLAEPSPDADTSAGVLILTEAGGKITNFSDYPDLTQRTDWLIGSNATSLHDQILQLIEEVRCYDSRG